MYYIYYMYYIPYMHYIYGGEQFRKIFTGGGGPNPDEPTWRSQPCPEVLRSISKPWRVPPKAFWERPQI